MESIRAKSGTIHGAHGRKPSVVLTDLHRERFLPSMLAGRVRLRFRLRAGGLA